MSTQALSDAKSWLDVLHDAEYRGRKDTDGAARYRLASRLGLTREQKHSLYAQFTVVGLAVAGMVYVFTTDAVPHEAPTGWSYPFSCCSSIDCREVADSDILEGPDGYRIRQNGETIGYSDSRVKDSPDGALHLCTVAGEDTGRTICLFVPPRGF